MNNKRILVVAEDALRAEKLVFVVRLGGYETRVFDNEAAALNWAKYGCHDEEVLCLVFNNSGGFERAEQIVSAWRIAGTVLPVILVQRGQGSWNQRLAIGEDEQFFVCEPEAVMQILDVLTEIAANNRLGIEGYTEKRIRFFEEGVQCK